jgi:hypothetical protein
MKRCAMTGGLIALQIHQMANASAAFLATRE